MTSKTRLNNFFTPDTDSANVSTIDGGSIRNVAARNSGDDMTYKFRILGLAILLAGAVAMLPLAKADQWNKETTVTFSEPVQIPGQVLAPGSYVFKLANNQSDRHIVQIFTEDQREIVATILAIPAYRLKPTDDTLVTFEERASGNPEAVSRWFYPGNLEGVAFLYPEDQR